VESFNRFSRLTVGVTLALAAMTAMCIAIFDPAAAKGFALGGLAGAGVSHASTDLSRASSNGSNWADGRRQHERLFASTGYSWKPRSTGQALSDHCSCLRPGIVRLLAGASKP